MKGIVGRKTKSCLELTEIPISTSSFINKTSPTSSPKQTHYWKNNGDRNTRCIKKENKKPKGLTKKNIFYWKTFLLQLNYLKMKRVSMLDH